MRILERVAEKIVTSRLLVLQSKRILLCNARTRQRIDATEQAAVDIERLEAAVHEAWERYHEAVLHFASPQTPQYRLVAFSSLIARAELLQSKLESASELGGVDRHELHAEMRNLEQILSGWRANLRASMMAAPA